MPKPMWAEPDPPPAPTKVPSPVPGYRVTTPWGKRPNNNTYWQARGHHTGDDYGDADGSGKVRGKPVVAVLAGRTVAYDDRVLGKIELLYVEIDGKPFTMWYCHLGDRKPAGKVKAGQVIGHVGATGTGAAMGPHLHLEKRAGHTTSWAGKDLPPRW